jgi:hypothetical protein
MRRTYGECVIHGPRTHIEEAREEAQRPHAVCLSEQACQSRRVRAGVYEQACKSRRVRAGV